MTDARPSKPPSGPAGASSVVNPITQLAAASAQLHELYQQLQASGFTKHEAMDLVKAAMLHKGK